MYNQILVFGASIVYGAWDSEGGWVARLRKDIDRRSAHLPSSQRQQILNLGVSGQTSTKVLNRFEAETEARVREKDKCLVIFSVGSNDYAWLEFEKKYVVDSELYRENLLTLITIGRKLNVSMLFLTLTPVDESITKIANHKGKVRRNVDVERYNSIVKSLCSQENIPMVDVYAAFMKTNHIQLLSSDGLHPNNTGHKVIFELVKKHIDSERL